MKSGSVYRRNLPSQWPVLGFRFGLGVLLLNTVRLFTTLPPTDYKEMPLQIHTRVVQPGLAQAVPTEKPSVLVGYPNAQSCCRHHPWPIVETGRPQHYPSQCTENS